MSRKAMFLGLSAVCAVALAAACSGAPQTPLSPSGASGEDAALNPDGSSLKVTAPTPLSPVDATIETRRPRLEFANAAGRFVPVSLAYQVEIRNEPGELVYSAIVGENPGTSAHEIDIDLELGANYWWRVRGRRGDEAGPWSSGLAWFRTPDRPAFGAGGVLGILPFPIPPECGPFGPGDRFGCVIAMTQVSPWWAACQAGSGTNCHRFTRSVAAALAAFDSGWGLLSKNPGEWQCTWDACGHFGGQGYGEDIVTHFDGATLRGWDMVTAAGAPGASPSWSRLGEFRSGNFWAPIPPLGSN